MNRDSKKTLSIDTWQYSTYHIPCSFTIRAVSRIPSPTTSQHTEEMLKNSVKCWARLYPRYGSSVTHLTQSATKTKDEDQHRLGSTTKTLNRLSWPQFSPNQIPAVNKQRSLDNDKPVFRRVINPEEAKVLERATQIVMYVRSIWWRALVVLEQERLVSSRLWGLAVVLRCWFKSNSGCHVFNLVTGLGSFGA